ncbi:hypothetical protein JHK87_027313 [Glycine soja]|nr:hypothetical protein JHK87_027313 [Glycine soja]
MENEINVLREEELNENFFKELSHVQEIHANCKVLLRTHHQAECRKLGDTDNPEVSELSKTAVHYLKEKSVLFKYCVEQVVGLSNLLKTNPEKGIHGDDADLLK